MLNEAGSEGPPDSGGQSGSGIPSFVIWIGLLLGSTD